MNWASGFVTQVKPVVRMLYAALASSSPGKSPHVYHKQIQLAMSWINNYLQHIECHLAWLQFAYFRHRCCLDFVVDAFPWGGGALLYKNNVYAEVFVLVWTKADELATGAKIGDPASQALWEAYMMLRCLCCWMVPGVTERGFVKIRRDAQGLLAAFLNRSAKSQLLNRIVKEVALHLAKHLCSVETLHIWSEQNGHADLLSRLADPGDLHNCRRSWLFSLECRTRQCVGMIRAW